MLMMLGQVGKVSAEEAGAGWPSVFWARAADAHDAPVDLPKLLRQGRSCSGYFVWGQGSYRSGYSGKLAKVLGKGQLMLRWRRLPVLLTRLSAARQLLLLMMLGAGRGFWGKCSQLMLMTLGQVAADAYEAFGARQRAS